jgi:XTP/dITP diphosphohydrolase
MKEIVIATRNPGKLEEFKVLMKDLEVELRSLEEWPNVPEPEETGKTFMANARLKAVYYAKETGLPCIADDSGLEVLALEGAPGVRSARYAGEEATDEENNKLLLQTMKFQVKRTCRFRCALAVAAPNGKILLESDGICDGMLLHEPLGTEGFGYDPLFCQQNCIRVWAKLRCRRKIKSAIAAKLLKNLLRIGGK